MGKWGDGEMGKWGNGEMGKWGNGEMGKWGNGEMGKWGGHCVRVAGGDGEMERINKNNLLTTDSYLLTPIS
ncbi:MAG: hypothetical protein EWV41_03045 [Microcystis wesenbergii Mw_MB_S_20031200_S109]|uniref:Isopentenyl pyrophosphate isomerase n=1 Tax=Microcystis wesenbergii Mw_MB_S_20031200_S109D TaxID=2486241 RepID=A0A552MBK9_9CHRO|nr:MAG: hypothetical protein EWV41_03045 [Microcystis wesenbergii Mw_MB_S_20031200_S109]TRV29853.1 MAG: hypothetical protein EWV88_00585 [Microcystis wesenbergii Mw_MB_S_20031200_S109D]